MTALRDAAYVAVFECSRAVRTRRAIALIAVFCVALGGSTWLFVQVVGLLEQQVAATLMIAAPEVPGTLLSELERSPLWRQVLTAMVGSPVLADALAGTPILALFDRWIGFVFVPFLSATSAAECLALDVGSRAIRYEAVRTGRGTVVLGRFAGQLALGAVASACGAAVVWAIGMFAMVGNPPVALAVGIAGATFRAWIFAIPFAAVGVLASSLVRSAAWARVLALAAVAGSWAAWGTATVAVVHGTRTEAFVGERVLPLLPQGWIAGLWDPHGWLSPVVLGLLGAGLASFAAARFAARDL